MLLWLFAKGGIYRFVADGNLHLVERLVKVCWKQGTDGWSFIFKIKTV